MPLLYDEAVSCCVNVLAHATNSYCQEKSGDTHMASLEAELERFWSDRLAHMVVAATGKGDALCPACGEWLDPIPLDCPKCYLNLIAE